MKAQRVEQGCKKSTIMRKGKFLGKEVCKEAQACTSKAERKCTCERKTRKSVRKREKEDEKESVLGKYGMQKNQSTQGSKSGGMRRGECE